MNKETLPLPQASASQLKMFRSHQKDTNIGATIKKPLQEKVTKRYLLKNAIPTFGVYLEAIDLVMFIDVLRGRFSCQCVGYYGMTPNLGSVVAVSVNSLVVGMNFLFQLRW